MQTTEPGRVMALDVGERRIGVAMSDPTRILASPTTTLRAQPRAMALARIAELIRENQVAELVVGLPLTLSGEVGPQAKSVLMFVEELRGVLELPIHTFDERLTSVEAERIMVELGLKPEQRKARIDEVAASLILQDFLDHHRNRPSAQDPPTATP
jgi:putative holliday junction resolvase